MLGAKSFIKYKIRLSSLYEKKRKSLKTVLEDAMNFFRSSLNLCWTEFQLNVVKRNPEQLQSQATQ